MSKNGAGAGPDTGPDTGQVWAAGVAVDASLGALRVGTLRSDGESIAAFGGGHVHRFTRSERALLLAARAGAAPAVRRAGELVEDISAALMSRLRRVAVIGFDGPRLVHDPETGRLVQPGNGALLAEALGVPVVWDLRSADMKLGGLGAPMLSCFHFACARRLGGAQAMAFVHLDATARLSWVDPAADLPFADRACLGFDAGPGPQTGPEAGPETGDAAGGTAAGGPAGEGTARAGAREGARARGQVGEGVPEKILKARFFHRLPPRLWRDSDEAVVRAALAPLSPEDARMTRRATVAAAVAEAFAHFPAAPARLLVSGPGRCDDVLLDMLRAGTGCAVLRIEEAGLAPAVAQGAGDAAPDAGADAGADVGADAGADVGSAGASGGRGSVPGDGDACRGAAGGAPPGAVFTAQGMAHLAVRVWRGLPTSGPATTGVAAAVGGGQISRPSGRF